MFVFQCWWIESNDEFCCKCLSKETLYTLISSKTTIHLPYHKIHPFVDVISLAIIDTLLYANNLVQRCYHFTLNFHYWHRTSQSTETQSIHPYWIVHSWTELWCTEFEKLIPTIWSQLWWSMNVFELCTELWCDSVCRTGQM